MLHAGEGNANLSLILGDNSVLLLDGEAHLRQRRLLLPPFHGERMRAYGELMARGRRPPRRRLAARAPVLDPAEHAGDHPRGDPARRLRRRRGGPARDRRRAAAPAARPGRQPVPGAGDRDDLRPPRPAQPLGAVPAACARTRDAVLFEEIRRRRADPDGAEGDDIFSLLLAARDENGEPLTDQELRDELMTLLVAGHETTATALAWLLERVTRSPRVLGRLLDEHRSGGDAYLDAVIKETLRLRPVVPAVIRRLQAPIELGPWDLPAGVYVAPSIYLLHRRPDLYPEPLEFRPERFLGDDPPGTYEWIPFGGGIRRCLGASFALFEMKAVVSTILERAELRPAPGAAPERTTRRAITLAPTRGGRIALA